VPHSMLRVDTAAFCMAILVGVQGGYEGDRREVESPDQNSGKIILCLRCPKVVVIEENEVPE
jgi:hypothetical protein